MSASDHSRPEKVRIHCRVIAPPGDTLPEHAFVQVRIEDVSLQDAPAQVVSKVETDLHRLNELEPIPVTADLLPGHTYSVAARVRPSETRTSDQGTHGGVGGNTVVIPGDFITTAYHEVSVKLNGRQIDLPLTRVAMSAE